MKDVLDTFPDDVADGVFTSPHYERLEAAFVRHEALGASPPRATALAPRLTLGDEQTDPAEQQLVDEAHEAEAVWASGEALDTK